MYNASNTTLYIVAAVLAALALFLLIGMLASTRVREWVERQGVESDWATEAIRDKR